MKKGRIMKEIRASKCWIIKELVSRVGTDVIGGLRNFFTFVSSFQETVLIAKSAT